MNKKGMSDKNILEIVRAVVILIFAYLIYKAIMASLGNSG